MRKNLDACLVLARIIEARNPYTYRHSARVAVLASRFGGFLGLGAEMVEALRLGSLLHDVGKVGVPDAILLKPGPLDVEEIVCLREHPAIGWRIVEPLGLKPALLEIVLHHHERWDGGGYPGGLAGGAIPLAARVVALADAYDAMLSERPYRSRLSGEAARREILARAGSHFAPDLAPAFVEFLDAIPAGGECWPEVAAALAVGWPVREPDRPRERA